MQLKQQTSSAASRSDVFDILVIFTKYGTAEYLDPLYIIRLIVKHDIDLLINDILNY